MKLSNMTKGELELYSYNDLTKMILEEEEKTLNTPTIFRKICDLLELSEDEYAASEKEVQKLIDKYTEMADKQCGEKEQEVMKV